MAYSIEQLSSGSSLTITKTSNAFYDVFSNKYLPIINAQSKYNDPLQDVKQQKLQEEKANRNYEYEKEIIESSKKDIEDVATHFTNPTELHNILKALSTNPSLFDTMKYLGAVKYPGIKNQPEGWKSLVIKKILENPNTPSEALSEYWDNIIKRLAGESSYIDGIVRDQSKTEFVKKILKHKNCPPNVFEDFSEFLFHNQKIAPYFKDIVFDIVSEIEDLLPNLTEKTLENLYKIKFFHKIPSIMKSIATNKNAPLNTAVNYVLQSQDVKKVNEINNIKAIEQIAKINQSVSNFRPEKIAALVNDQSTSTEVLSIITNVRKDLEKVYNEPEALNLALNSPSGILIQDENTEKELNLNDFFKKMDEAVACHQNAPVDWAVDYCVRNDVYIEKIKNKEVYKKAKDAIFKKYKEKPAIPFSDNSRLDEYRKLLLEED
jgi:hypothetical protein